MKNLRNRFERFCYQNRTKGIPNLMLFVSLGSALVYIMSMFDQSSILYSILCFNRKAILQGQIWRLFTYVFTYDAGNILLTAVSLFCYYSLGRAMEITWGTFRFNLFYFTGMILMDAFCMLFGGSANVYYLNLSMFIGYATLYPDTRFFLFFIIPVKAWIFALIDLVLTFYDVAYFTAIGYIPYNLFPLIALANYFLFFGKDVVNLFPMSWRIKLGRKKKTQTTSANSGPIPFNPGSRQSVKVKVTLPYNHRCTVCGKTDISHPDMEFRYCSRCSGYRCYCQEHINNHTHIIDQGDTE